MKKKNAAMLEAVASPSSPLLSDPAFASSAFEKIFSSLPVDQLRRQLQDLTESVLAAAGSNTPSWFAFFVQLENLLETAYAAHQMAGKNLHRSSPESAHSTEPTEEKFYKPPKFEEMAELHPAEALAAAFRACSADDLIDEVVKWKRCILTGAIHLYDECELREQVWTFCDQLLCLVESAEAFSRSDRPSEKKEMSAFFDHCTLTYAKRELWDCFESVVNDQRQDTGIEKTSVTLTYRCLLTIVVAAYYLLEDADTAVLTTLENEIG